MNRNKSIPLMNSLSILVHLAGYFFIAISLISLYFTLTDNWSWMVDQCPGLFQRGEIKSLTKQLGKFAEITVIAAAGFWILKTLLSQLKKRSNSFTDVWNKKITFIVQKSMLFLKKHHRFLGWITVILASGHGLYFLLFPDEKIKFFYTGLAALIGLILVAIVGIIFDQLMKKNKAVKAGRRYHFSAAALFAVTFLVHLYY